MTGRHRRNGESDVPDDQHVAGSRAGSEDDGAYVGRQGPDDAFDAGQTGAEARSHDGD